MKKLENGLNEPDILKLEQIEIILSRLTIAITYGTAFRLVIHLEIVLQEYALWSPFRNMLLALFDGTIDRG